MAELAVDNRPVEADRPRKQTWIRRIRVVNGWITEAAVREADMNMVAEYPQEIRDTVAAMLRDGASNRTITEASKAWDGVPKAGVSGALIASVAKEAGVLRGPGGRVVTPERHAELAKIITGKAKITLEQREEMVAEAGRLVKSGPVDFAKLGALYGVGPDTVRIYLKRAGWRQPPGKLFLAPPATNGVAPAEMPVEVPVVEAPKGRSTLTLVEEQQRFSLLRRIVQAGGFKTDNEVTNASHKWPEIRLGGHEVTHVLYDLKRTGHITAREHPSGPSGKRLLRIRSTVLGQRTVKMLDSTNAEPKQNEKPKPKLDNTSPYTGAARNEFLAETRQATGYTGSKEGIVALMPEPPAPVEPAAAPQTPKVAAPKAPSQGYPLLAALQARAKTRAEEASRRDALLEAAGLLAKLDPEESERLLARANTAEGEPFSPVEAEYLAFAASRSLTDWMAKPVG
jgi:hypothetical protein